MERVDTDESAAAATHHKGLPPSGDQKDTECGPDTRARATETTHVRPEPIPSERRPSTPHKRSDPRQQSSPTPPQQEGAAQEVNAQQQQQHQQQQDVVARERASTRGGAERKRNRLWCALICAVAIGTIVVALVGWAIARRLTFVRDPPCVSARRPLREYAFATGHLVLTSNREGRRGSARSHVWADWSVPIKLLTASCFNHAAIAYVDPETRQVMFWEINGSGTRLATMRDFMSGRPDHDVFVRAIDPPVDPTLFECAMHAQWEHQFNFFAPAAVLRRVTGRAHRMQRDSLVSRDPVWSHWHKVTAQSTDPSRDADPQCPGSLSHPWWSCGGAPIAPAFWGGAMPPLPPFYMTPLFPWHPQMWPPMSPMPVQQPRQFVVTDRTSDSAPPVIVDDAVPLPQKRRRGRRAPKRTCAHLVAELYHLVGVLDYDTTGREGEGDGGSTSQHRETKSNDHRTICGIDPASVFAGDFAREPIDPDVLPVSARHSFGPIIQLTW